MEAQIKHQVLKTIDLFMSQSFVTGVHYDDLVELYDLVDNDEMMPIIALSQANAIFNNCSKNH